VKKCAAVARQGRFMVVEEVSGGEDELGSRKGSTVVRSMR